MNRTQAAEIDLGLQTCPNKGPNMSSVWTCLAVPAIFRRKPFFVRVDLDLWPLTLTFELVRARNQRRLPCEFVVKPFSGFQDISYTTKKSQTARQKQNLAQFTACGNYPQPVVISSLNKRTTVSRWCWCRRSSVVDRRLRLTSRQSSAPDRTGTWHSAWPPSGCRSRGSRRTPDRRRRRHDHGRTVHLGATQRRLRPTPSRCRCRRSRSLVQLSASCTSLRSSWAARSADQQQLRNSTSITLPNSFSIFFTSLTGLGIWTSQPTIEITWLTRLRDIGPLLTVSSIGGGRPLKVEGQEWRSKAVPKWRPGKAPAGVWVRSSVSRRQPNYAALNRGRHLYSAGRPSRWALASF